MITTDKYYAEGIEFIKDCMNDIEMKRTGGDTIKNFDPYMDEIIKELKNEKSIIWSNTEVVDDENGYEIDDYFYTMSQIKDWIFEEIEKGHIRAFARAFALGTLEDF